MNDYDVETCGSVIVVGAPTMYDFRIDLIRYPAICVEDIQY